jgi:hypothetical protein
VTVSVLDSQGGLADPTHAVQRVRHRRATGQQRTAQLSEQLDPADERGMGRLHLAGAPSTSTTDP